MSDERREASELAWLQSVCSTEERRAGALGHPWTIDRDGEHWTVASDGRVLAACRGGFGFPAANDDTPNFGSVMGMPDVDAAILPLAELRALATPWIAENIPACEKCNSTGIIDCDECEGAGGEECECHCGDVHETDCVECDGNGFVECADCPRGAKEAREVRPVWIAESLFDLRLFARFLPYIADDAATFRQVSHNRGAFLEVGGWLVVVMPIDREQSGEKYAAAPRIALDALSGSPLAPTQEGK